ncbi:MAG TPA: VWA domain-containing protein [Candidatus Acidoferrales bacterium]
MAWPFVSLLILFCASSNPLARAGQETTEQGPQPIQSASDLVAVDVSVLDRSGNFYPGLSQKDFRVLDNGEEKPIRFFTPVQAPAQVLILMETGPAVFLIHDQHLLALSSLLQGLAPDDQAGLFAYADTVGEVVPFTTDKDALRSSIDESQYIVGMDHLNFYDAIRAAMDRFPPGSGKKAIVALSTGLDDSPEGHWDLLEQKLRANDVVIFAVGLGGPLRGDAPDKPRKKSKKKDGMVNQESGPTPAFAHADEVLRSIAQITGGRAYFPQTPDDYAPAYREIAAALRNQYVLGITPDHDGSFHKLSIDVVDTSVRKHKSNAAKKTPLFRTFYREGYLAPSP